MFTGGIVGRGIVYSMLMLFAKLITGVWLVRMRIQRKLRLPTSLLSFSKASCSWWVSAKPKNSTPEENNDADAYEMEARPKHTNSDPGNLTAQNTTGESRSCPAPNAPSSPPTSPSRTSPTASQPKPKKIKKPLSLYPAVMLGTAMTARSEIGFLTASLAETTVSLGSS